MSSIPLHKPDAGWEPLLQELHQGLAPELEVDVLGQGAALTPSLAALFSEEACARVGAYLDLVVKWNARHDLTAARDERELVDLFVADAALVGALTAHDTLSLNQRWVDIGSGGGAPGLPLKVLLPDLNIQLVEPRTKRAAFLRTVVGSLALVSTRVHRLRSEDLPDADFGVGISRATFPPPEWLAEGARLCSSELWVLLAQAEAPVREDWRLVQLVRYRWPLSGVERTLARYRARSGGEH